MLLADALACGVRLDTVFVEGAAERDATELLDQARSGGAEVAVVADGSLRSVLDVTTARPIAATAVLDPGTLADVDLAEVVLVLVDVADPGNVGTLIRTAEAAGVAAVVLCGETADPYAPKVVRSSAGSLFRVRVVVEHADATEVIARLGETSRRIVAACTRGGAPPDGVDLTGRIAVVVGGEARGLPSVLEEAADLRVTIPLAGRAESLNVAMAGTVLCFEASRQRR